VFAQLLVTRASNLRQTTSIQNEWSGILNPCSSSEWKFRCVPDKISEDKHLPWLPKIQAKDAPLHIRLAGLSKLGGCLICLLQLEKSLKRWEFRGELSPLLCICQNGIWGSMRHPAKIWLPYPSKFRISKELCLFLPINFMDLQMCNWLQADPSHLLHNPKEILNASPWLISKNPGCTKKKQLTVPLIWTATEEN
jgi:hypothetical protein